MDIPKNKKIQKAVPIIFTAIIIIICLIFLKSHSFSELLDYTPKNHWLAFAAFMGFFALKSMSVVFPVNAIFVAVGAMYPLPIAIAVNLAGLTVTFTLPYLVGGYSGAEAVDYLSEKYPKIGGIAGYSHRNSLFTCYISRALVAVPADLISMVHGALKMPYKSYILGSQLGELPEMLVYTYVGAKLDEMDTKTAVILLILMALTIALSIFLKRFQED